MTLTRRLQRFAFLCSGSRQQLRKEAPGVTEKPATYKKIAAHKMFVWVNPQGDAYKQTEDALNRWLDKLQAR